MSVVSNLIDLNRHFTQYIYYLYTKTMNKFDTIDSTMYNEVSTNR